MIASQSKVLEQNEVFELPPYADSILLVGTGGTGVTVEHSPDGITFYGAGVSGIVGETNLFKINDAVIFPKIKIISSGGATIHYRVSKR